MYESSDRGIHVVVLNQFSGEVMAADAFDLFTSKESNGLMIAFVRSISNAGRIVVMAVCDEGTFNVNDILREEVKKLGSLLFHKLQWRSMWAFVSCNFTSLGEQINDPPENAFVRMRTFSDNFLYVYVLLEPIFVLSIAGCVGRAALAGDQPGCEGKGGGGGELLHQVDGHDGGRQASCGEKRPHDHRPQPTDFLKLFFNRQFCLRYEGYGEFCQCRKRDSRSDQLEAIVNPDNIIPLKNSQLNQVQLKFKLLAHLYITSSHQQRRRCRYPP